MKETLQPGVSKTRRISVDDDRVITHLGKDLAIYGTPFLVRDIEATCHALLLEHLDEGEGSVGMRVDVEHLAPTPRGFWVDITATVSEVKGRQVTFTVEGRDALDHVARCTHSRFVVALSKSKERIAAKIARAAEQG
ncbi:MAG: LysR family transcriptional regulator [Gammaproteobacteria bacterium]|nr:LysR family transcriptional regulator [Gammaproteobacteria bacterium]